LTTIAVLADIHGNLPAVDAIERDLTGVPVDAVVAAGDLINWGPFSRQVLERAAERGWLVLRGNNELYLTDFGTPRAPAAWSEAARYPLLPWLQRQVGAEWRARIATWPDSLVLRFADAPPLCVAHGLPDDPWHGIHTSDPDDQVARSLGGLSATTFVTGHTHLQFERQVGPWQIVNPGSAGVPLHGRREACYALLVGDDSGWRAALRRAPYDVRPVLREFARIGYVEELGVVGRLCVEEFRTARMHLVAFHNWRDACCPDEPLAMDLFDRYTRADWAPLVRSDYRVDRSDDEAFTTAEGCS
jgi:predicted phosphodiesterase